MAEKVNPDIYIYKSMDNMHAIEHRNFNVGSENFTPIYNLDELVKNTNYLIRIRKDGEERIDFIGKFYKKNGPRVLFKTIYYRIPRLNNTDDYNEWEKMTPTPLVLFENFFNNESGFRIFDLGKYRNIITSDIHPNMVEPIVNELDNTLINNPRFPPSLRNDIYNLLGGKNRKSRRYRKSRKSRNFNKSRKNRKV
jgi:hypothetical protein